MKTVSVASFKAQFSALLDQVLAGQKIAIQYGRKKEVVAWLVPANQKWAGKRPLGILEGKARFELRRNFKIAEEEFLQR